MPSLALSVILVSCYFHLGSSNSVIIIGAGPAGIAAATKLLENGVTNITVLEAENRIGGRIHSVKFGEAFVDLGAEFCHGQKGNVVYDLVKDLDILEPSPGERVIYYSNSSRVHIELKKELLTFQSTYEDGDKERSELSSAEFFLLQYNKTILKKYEKDHQKLKFFKEAISLGKMATEMNEGCFSWIEPSSESHYEECEGNQMQSWTGHGYKTILEVLMKSYPDTSQKLDIHSKIVLGQEVTRINWNNGDSKISVQTSNNTVFKADYVIFTPSIGVLKATQEQLFHPQLPVSKRKAIEETGFGGGLKIIMHFPNRWWTDEDNIFAFIWSQEDLNKITTEFPYGPVIDGVSWISQIRVVMSSSRNPNVRIAWMTTELIKEVELLDLQTLKKGLVYVFNKFLGKDYNVSEPDQIIRSSWCTNPHFRGTYSFERVEFYKKNVSIQRVLAKPLEDASGRPVVLFAGEATNPIHYSTVHGAIETGHREAGRIIELSKIKANQS